MSNNLPMKSYDMEALPATFPKTFTADQLSTLVAVTETKTGALGNFDNINDKTRLLCARNGNKAIVFDAKSKTATSMSMEEFGMHDYGQNRSMQEDMFSYPSPNKEYDPVTHYGLGKFQKPAQDKQDLAKMVMKLFKSADAENTTGLIVDKLRGVDYEFDSRNYTGELAEGQKELHVKEASLAQKVHEGLSNKSKDVTYSPEEMMMLANLIEEMAHVQKSSRGHTGSRKQATANTQQFREEQAAKTLSDIQKAAAEDAWGNV